MCVNGSTAHNLCFSAISRHSWPNSNKARLQPTSRMRQSKSATSWWTQWSISQVMCQIFPSGFGGDQSESGGESILDWHSSGRQKHDSRGQFGTKIHDETKPLQRFNLAHFSSTQASWGRCLRVSLSSHQRLVLEQKVTYFSSQSARSKVSKCKWQISGQRKERMNLFEE